MQRLTSCRMLWDSSTTDANLGPMASFIMLDYIRSHCPPHAHDEARKVDAPPSTYLMKGHREKHDKRMHAWLVDTALLLSTLTVSDPHQLRHWHQLFLAFCQEWIVR